MQLGSWNKNAVVLIHTVVHVTLFARYYGWGITSEWPTVTHCLKEDNASQYKNWKFCGTWDNKAGSTDTVWILINKVWKQLGWKCSRNDADVMKLTSYWHCCRLMKIWRMLTQFRRSYTAVLWQLGWNCWGTQMKVTSYWGSWNKTLEDTNTVGMKLPQYCGSWDQQAEGTEAVWVKLHKTQKQLRWKYEINKANDMKLTS